MDNTCGTVTTDSDTVGTANTVNYSTVEAKTVTTEYSTDGKSEGFYRCVTATDLHVFGVVGYDIGHKAFFTYTYSVADGRTYDFLLEKVLDKTGNEVAAYGQTQDGMLCFEKSGIYTLRIAVSNDAGKRKRYQIAVSVARK